MSYRNLLKQAMADVGLSQLALAAKARVDRAYLQKVAAGKCRPHVAKQVKRLERALRIKDKRLQIAAAVDRGEIDVSHLPRRERERIARMVLGVPEPTPVSEGLDRREVEEIETSEAMKKPAIMGYPSPFETSKNRKEPREGTLNARVLTVLRTRLARVLPAYIADAVVPSESVERVSNALSSLRTAGWAKSEPGRNGRERLWSLA